MRIIIYTGKGGVGKTSVSAATARRLAKLGYRTLLMSTDSAHSLGDSLDVDLPNYPFNISENLDALEIDIIYEMRTRWAEISEYVTTFLTSQGLGEITAEEMAIVPGMEMIAALFYVLQFEENDEYDVIVMDTAPTGETLQLLSFPDISNWYIERFYSMFKRMISVARYTVSKVINLPLPNKEVMNSIDEIREKMVKVRDILENPGSTTIRLVLNPERMVINETMRTYTYTCLYNKTVECLIINKIYPREGLEHSYFEDRLVEQEKYLKEIDDAFSPLKIFKAPQMSTELRGPEKLDLLAELLFGDSDPSEVYAEESPMRFDSEDGIDRLIMKMPFVKKDDIEMFRGDNDVLIIQVGSHRKTVTLPLTLRDAEILDAELVNEELTVRLKRKNVANQDR